MRGEFSLARARSSSSSYLEVQVNLWFIYGSFKTLHNHTGATCKKEVNI